MGKEKGYNGDRARDACVDHHAAKSVAAHPRVPSTDSARDLGTTSLYWANAYIDAIATTGNINAGGMISGSFISSSRAFVAEVDADVEACCAFVAAVAADVEDADAGAE